MVYRASGHWGILLGVSLVVAVHEIYLFKAHLVIVFLVLMYLADKKEITIYTLRGNIIKHNLGPPRIQFSLYLVLIFNSICSTVANSNGFS